jgi:hypothetical protein
VLNAAMVPESLLSAFLHEYGHAEYRITHQDKYDEIASEVTAIRRSLELLGNEGFPELAYREAANVKEMTDSEPYKSAVARLVNDPLWVKYANVQ